MFNWESYLERKEEVSCHGGSSGQVFFTGLDSFSFPFVYIYNPVLVLLVKNHTGQDSVRSDVQPPGEPTGTQLQASQGATITTRGPTTGQLSSLHVYWILNLLVNKASRVE
ncbi:hypothetical protein MLD38_001058 [Melastoma candidum]|uniref:Uncharacterized protein n=1 Tax=Melastoma candidum TaxID=119954 RepID=A0ACB9SBG8_9MYRT|nr:hypothetical protein MLD38_001058 [Melastoma candidum]